MRVVVGSVGTRGAVPPMLALAQGGAGTRRSSRAPRASRPSCARGGVEHRALGEELSALMAEKGAAFERSRAGMKRYFTEQLLAQAPRLVEIATGAGAIVGTAIVWSAPSGAEELGIPALELLPSSVAPSRLHPRPTTPRTCVGLR